MANHATQGTARREEALNTGGIQGSTTCPGNCKGRGRVSAQLRQCALMCPSCATCPKQALAHHGCCHKNMSGHRGLTLNMPASEGHPAEAMLRARPFAKHRTSGDPQSRGQLLQGWLRDKEDTDGWTESMSHSPKNHETLIGDWYSRSLSLSRVPSGSVPVRQPAARLAGIEFFHPQ